MTRDNNVLGRFDLTGIPPAKRGLPKIEVTFDLDANGILNVSAKELSTGIVKNIVIKNDKGRLSQSDIDRMLADAEHYRDEDEKTREKISARNNLESYVYNVKQTVDLANNVTENEKQTAMNSCNEIIKWLDSNALADKDEYDYKMKEVTNVCSPIMTKINSGVNETCGQEARHSFNPGRSGPTIEEVD